LVPVAGLVLELVMEQGLVLVQEWEPEPVLVQAPELELEPVLVLVQAPGQHKQRPRLPLIPAQV